MKSLNKITITTPINLDNGCSNVNLIEEAKSTLELFEIEEGFKYLIEWDIEKLDMVEHIGIFCSNGNKIVTDYDGVFEVPKEAITFLEENGFNCEYLKD